MRLSIALCTYNGAKYLNEQLQSFSGQERLPDELVVADDGSTDSTLSLLEQFATQAPFPVRITRNVSNLGYSRNFTYAASLCTGDVIAFSDQDDYWYPRKLARLCEIFETQPDVQGIFSDGDVMNDLSQTVGRSLWESFLFDASEQERFRSGGAVDVLLRRNVVTGMTFAFRRALGDLMQDRPESWMHDGWLAFLLALEAGLYACPERLVKYRVHGLQEVGTPLSFRGKLQWLQSRGIRAYRQRVHDLNLDEYRRTALQFDDLSSYLEQKHPGGAEVMGKVRAKASHAHRGLKALSSKRLSRLALLLPHAASYTCFSPNGIRGLPRDLLV